MARVFVSYRRADGAYGVGWIAERLKSLDLVNEVQTAFHDAALRAGDDFHDALEAELESCELVLAVIGPHWAGQSPTGGPSRIQDEDDWVVREIATAFRMNKRVVPVILTGGGHPRAAEIHPSIHPLTRLHAVRFADGRDLETLVTQVETYLEERDREEATLAGLEQPITVPKLPYRAWLIAACLVLAALGAGIGWWARGEGICGDGSVACRLSGGGAESAVAVLLPLTGLYIGAVAPVGGLMALNVHRVARVRWPAVLAIGGIGAGGVALAIESFRSTEPDATVVGSQLTVWLIFAIIVLAVAPWTVALNAAACSQPRAPAHHLAARVRYLATIEDAERWAALVLAVVIAFAVAAVGSISGASAELTFPPVLLLTFAVLVSALLIGSHLWNAQRIEQFEVLLKRDLEQLAPRYRDNARIAAIAGTPLGRGFGVGAFLAQPALVGVIVVLIAAVS